MYSFSGKTHSGFMGIVGKDWIPISLGGMFGLLFLQTGKLPIALLIIAVSFALSFIKVSKRSLWEISLSLLMFAFKTHKNQVRNIFFSTAEKEENQELKFLNLIPEIEDGVYPAIQSKGFHTVVFQINPLGGNFALQEEMEIENILAGFGSFLNTLATRKTVSSFKLIEVHAPNTEASHIKWYRDYGRKTPFYEEVLNNSAAATSIHKFLFQIDFAVQNAKATLQNEVNAILNDLTQSGLSGKVLNATEVETIINSIVDPQSLFLDDLDYVRSTGFKRIFSWEEKLNSLKINEVDFKLFKVLDLPSNEVDGSFMWSFLAQKFDFPRVVTFDFKPISQWRALRQAERETTTTESEVRRKARQGFDFRAKDEQELQGALRREKEIALGAAMFNIQGGVLVSSAYDIKNVSSAITTAAARVGIRIAPAFSQQKDLLNIVLPMQSRKKINYHALTTYQAQALFLGQFGESLPSLGVVWGKNSLDNSVFAFDAFAYYKAQLITNPSMLIMGVIGKGKSSLTKLFLGREFSVCQRRVLVLDPKGEYDKLATIFNIPRINLSPTSGYKINPLEALGLDDDALLRHRVMIISALASITLKRDIMPNETIAITSTVSFLNRNALLKDFVATATNPSEELIRHFDGTKEKFKSSIEAVSDAIKTLVIGELGELFNGQTTVAINEKTGAIIDLSLVYSNPELLSPLMVVVTSLFQKIIFSKKRPTILALDEAWRVTTDNKSLEFLRSTIKLARALGVQVILITQHLGDFDVEANNSAIKAENLLADIGMVVTFAQPSDKVELTGKLLNLNSKQKNLLPTLQRGQAMVVIKDRQTTSIIDVEISPFELGLINTNEAMEASSREKNLVVETTAT